MLVNTDCGVGKSLVDLLVSKKGNFMTKAQVNLVYASADGFNGGDAFDDATRRALISQFWQTHI